MNHLFVCTFFHFGGNMIFIIIIMIIVTVMVLAEFEFELVDGLIVIVLLRARRDSGTSRAFL